MELPKNVLFLSGCGWNDSGGAQRPAQLARQFKRLGLNVFHWSACDKESGWSPDGVRLVGKEWWTDEDWPESGLVICALPAYADLALRFHKWGWHIVYDLLDDWEEFHKIGYHLEDPREGEQKLLEVCLAATASAPVLMEHLERAGVKHRELVPNGGPEEPIANRKEWIRHRAVLSSYLFGPWMDWNAIRLVSEEEDLYAEIIGKHTGEREGSIVQNAPNACFLGEMPHAMAMRVIASCDASMIPFKGNLCRAVDPIKYYDAVAAGLWTVHTPELWPLFERPQTIMAAPPEFPDAIREAASLKVPKALQHVVAENAWSSRARQMLDFLLRVPDPPVRVASRPRRAPYPYQGLEAKDCKLRLTVAIPSTCQLDRLDKTCKYCCNADERRIKPSLSGTPRQWREGLQRLARKYGPCYFSACYGDAVADPDALDIFAELALENKMDLVTNMIATDEEWAIFPRNGNVALATTFHPHAWRGGLRAFLERREEIRASGLICGIVSVVGWPPYLKRIPEWREKALDWGVRLYVIPYGGWYKDKAYPGAYTRAEWDLVKQTDLAHYDMTGHNWGGEESPFGLPCRTGMEGTYIFIAHDGTVHRCYMPGQGSAIGNILGSQPIRFLEEPKPCPHNTCPCADMWQFIEAPDDIALPPKREYAGPAANVERVELRLGDHTVSGVKLQGESGTIRLTRQDPLAVA